jgi:hypothetical protein
MTIPATVSDFKSQFDRDFIYGSGLEFVRDQDISRALNEASSVFNPDLWTSDEVKNAYLYAAAHFLVMNVQMAGGLSSPSTGKGIDSRGGGIIQSKSVGQVSVNYSIPESLSNDPLLTQFMRTDYGQKYLQLLTPRLVGNIGVLPGNNDTEEPYGGI